MRVGEFVCADSSASRAGSRELRPQTREIDKKQHADDSMSIDWTLNMRRKCCRFFSSSKINQDNERRANATTFSLCNQDVKPAISSEPRREQRQVISLDHVGIQEQTFAAQAHTSSSMNQKRVNGLVKVAANKTQLNEQRSSSLKLMKQQCDTNQLVAKATCCQSDNLSALSASSSLLSQLLNSSLNQLIEIDDGSSASCELDYVKDHESEFEFGRKAKQQVDERDLFVREPSRFANRPPAMRHRSQAQSSYLQSRSMPISPPKSQFKATGGHLEGERRATSVAANNDKCNSPAISSSLTQSEVFTAMLQRQLATCFPDLPQNALEAPKQFVTFDRNNNNNNNQAASGRIEVDTQLISHLMQSSDRRKDCEPDEEEEEVELRQVKQVAHTFATCPSQLSGSFGRTTPADLELECCKDCPPEPLINGNTNQLLQQHDSLLEVSQQQQQQQVEEQDFQCCPFCFQFEASLMSVGHQAAYQSGQDPQATIDDQTSQTKRSISASVLSSCSSSSSSSSSCGVRVTTTDCSSEDTCGPERAEKQQVSEPIRCHDQVMGSTNSRTSPTARREKSASKEEKEEEEEIKKQEPQDFDWLLSGAYADIKSQLEKSPISYLHELANTSFVLPLNTTFRATPKELPSGRGEEPGSPIFSLDPRTLKRLDGRAAAADSEADHCSMLEATANLARVVSCESSRATSVVSSSASSLRRLARPPRAPTAREEPIYDIPSLSLANSPDLQVVGEQSGARRCLSPDQKYPARGARISLVRRTSDKAKAPAPPETNCSIPSRARQLAHRQVNCEAGKRSDSECNCKQCAHLRALKLYLRSREERKSGARFDLSSVSRLAVDGSEPLSWRQRRKSRSRPENSSESRMTSCCSSCCSHATSVYLRQSAISKLGRCCSCSCSSSGSSTLRSLSGSERANATPGSLSQEYLRRHRSGRRRLRRRSHKQRSQNRHGRPLGSRRMASLGRSRRRSGEYQVNSELARVRLAGRPDRLIRDGHASDELPLVLKSERRANFDSLAGSKGRRLVSYQRLAEESEPNESAHCHQLAASSRDRRLESRQRDSSDLDLARARGGGRPSAKGTLRRGSVGNSNNYAPAQQVVSDCKGLSAKRADERCKSDDGSMAAQPTTEPPAEEPPSGFGAGKSWREEVGRDRSFGAGERLKAKTLASKRKMDALWSDLNRSPPTCWLQAKRTGRKREEKESNYSRHALSRRLEMGSREVADGVGCALSADSCSCHVVRSKRHRRIRRRSRHHHANRRRRPNGHRKRHPCQACCSKYKGVNDDYDGRPASVHGRHFLCKLKPHSKQRKLIRLLRMQQQELERARFKQLELARQSEIMRLSLEQRRQLKNQQQQQLFTLIKQNRSQQSEPTLAKDKRMCRLRANKGHPLRFAGQLSSTCSGSLNSRSYLKNGRRFGQNQRRNSRATMNQLRFMQKALIGSSSAKQVDAQEATGAFEEQLMDKFLVKAMAPLPPPRTANMSASNLFNWQLASRCQCSHCCLVERFILMDAEAKQRKKSEAKQKQLVLRRQQAD